MGPGCALPGPQSWGAPNTELGSPKHRAGEPQTQSWEPQTQTWGAPNTELGSTKHWAGGRQEQPQLGIARSLKFDSLQIPHDCDTGRSHLPPCIMDVVSLAKSAGSTAALCSFVSLKLPSSIKFYFFAGELCSKWAELQYIHANNLRWNSAQQQLHAKDL